MVPSSNNNTICELKETVAMLDLDVLCISEKWPHSKVKNAEIEISGYALFQKDRKNREGGVVAVYAKSTYLPKPFKLWSEWDFGLQKGVYWGPKPKSLVMGAMYRPPKCKADAFHYTGSHMEALAWKKVCTF